MCVCACTRSIKSAIEFVCAHVKDIEWLAYWNMRGDMCSLSLWHGYQPTALDYLWVVGGGQIKYRGTMTGICVEEERGLPHVLRRSICLMYYGISIGIHAYVHERNKVGREIELECWRGW